MKMESAGTYKIENGDRPAMLYVGKRSDPKLPWKDISKFYMDNLKPSWDAVTAAKVSPAGAPSGIYFDWNVEAQTTDMMAAVPVPADAKGKVKGLTEYEVPAGKAYWTSYTGGYSGMKPAHDAVNAKLEADGMEIDKVVIEEYLTDPGTEPDSTKWVTNIIYMAKPKSTEQAMK
jgi:effector-binding domain-containing protein